MKRLIILSLLLVVFSFGKVFSQTVYITQNGIKYHTKACKNVGPTAEKVTLYQAQQYNKRPCSECHPPTKVVATKKKPVKKKAAPAKKPAAKPATTKTAAPAKK